MHEATKREHPARRIVTMPVHRTPLSSIPRHIDERRGARPTMEIAVIVILFLIGTIASAIQALKYVERKRKLQNKGKPGDKPPSEQSRT
jgi:hypothetical protein